MKEPATSAEWREAVDAAAALSAIADCKMYGLLKGGPEIDVERCEQILRRGRARGVLPSNSLQKLAVEMVSQLNAAADL